MASINNHIEHEIMKMAIMLGQLPAETSKPLLEQFHLILKSIANSTIQTYAFLQRVDKNLSDLGLDISYIKFDLESTRRERDELKSQLGL